jgi:hypothetical protein
MFFQQEASSVAHSSYNMLSRASSDNVSVHQYKLWVFWVYKVLDELMFLRINN